MKRLIFITTLVLSAGLFLTACGDNNRQTEKEEESSVTLTPTAEATPTTTPAAVAATATPTLAPVEEEDTEAEEKEEFNMKEFEENMIVMPLKGYDSTKEGVDYPKFKKYTYYSRTAERDTNVNVLLPKDYSEDKKYPVMYFLHGYYNNEDWLTTKNVMCSQIYTNLLRQGRAEEMIIVSPYIFCSKELPYCTAMDNENTLAYDNFVNDLITDLMPFIEENFSVATGRENTAITGFSMGGRESLFIGCTHPELFGFVGAVCPAPGLVRSEGMPTAMGQLLESELSFGDYPPTVLMISSSKIDGTVGSSPDQYRQVFEKNGQEFISHVMSSTHHDHTSVKPHLYNFFLTLFK